MTALKPIENRRVRGVASERYPLNEMCAHPECREHAVDPHHIFPRSEIGGDSWFVELLFAANDKALEMYDDFDKAPAILGTFQAIRVPLTGSFEVYSVVIPHVAGLCRAHHDDVEQHRAWIKLEEGVFVWHDRTERLAGVMPVIEWEELGPLNPQPGSREGKPKRRKFKGEQRRQRATISIKVPKDDREDGGQVWDETLEAARAKLARVGAIDPLEADTYPPYNVITMALHDWLTD